MHSGAHPHNPRRKEKKHDVMVWHCPKVRARFTPNSSGVMQTCVSQQHGAQASKKESQCGCCLIPFLFWHGESWCNVVTQGCPKKILGIILNVRSCFILQEQFVGRIIPSAVCYVAHLSATQKGKESTILFLGVVGHVPFVRQGILTTSSDVCPHIGKNSRWSDAPLSNVILPINFTSRSRKTCCCSFLGSDPLWLWAQPVKINHVISRHLISWQLIWIVGKQKKWQFSKLTVKGISCSAD